MIKVFIITGELSGDLLSANLVSTLKAANAELEFYAWGGDHLKTAGAKILLDPTQDAFMGAWEVIKRSTQIKERIRQCKNHIISVDPEVIIFVDYAGFNLPMAKWAQKKGYKTVYFIPPKLWAWNPKRVKKLKAYFDDIWCIFPFELEFYKKLGLSVRYLKNPLIDIINQHQVSPTFRKTNKLSERSILAILPGSRAQEIAKSQTVLSEAANKLNGYEICISKSPNLSRDHYSYLLHMIPHATLIENQHLDLLKHADFAWINSGTASLEAALIGLPHLVIYKTSRLFYLLAKRLIKVEYISLPNIIMNRHLVKELIQDQCNASSIVTQTLAHHPVDMKNAFEELKSLMHDIADTNDPHTLLSTLIKGKTEA